MDLARVAVSTTADPGPHPLAHQVVVQAAQSPGGEGIGAHSRSTPRSERIRMLRAFLDGPGRGPEQLVQRPLHAGRALGRPEEHGQHARTGSRGRPELPSSWRSLAISSL